MSPASTEVSHAAFPKSMVFQKTWRTYQARLWGHLDSYLEDKRLHIIAAPGSGKTVLGLEVVRRVDQPTLVLAPTITIRNQWADRLLDQFLPAGEPRPPWLSADLKKPALLTIATYQALHSLCSGELEKESEQINEEEGGNHSHDDVNSEVNGSRPIETLAQLPEVLKNAGFKTLVVDEAHHLRAELRASSVEVLASERTSVALRYSQRNAVGSELVAQTKVQATASGARHPGATRQWLPRFPSCKRNSDEQFRSIAETTPAETRPRRWLASHGDDLHARD